MRLTNDNIGTLPRVVLCLALAGLLLLTGAAKADPAPGSISEGKKRPPLMQTASSGRSGEQISWQVISAGATDASSACYALKGTAGQTAVGGGTSDNYGLSHGFWQDFGAGGTCCMPPIRGNVDYDGGDAIDISDLVYTVDYMFTGGPAPVCWEEANVDGSGDGPPDGSEDIDISDLVYLVDFMFNGGPEPVACP